MQGKKLWSEDECTRNTPGHETLRKAWKRLFGTEYDQSQQTKQINHGDCIEHQFGSISVWNIFGAQYEIWQREERNL